MTTYFVERLFNTKQGMIGLLCMIAVISIPFFALQYNLDLFILLPFMAMFLAISILSADIFEWNDNE